jgi:UDP-glucose 4-epimerase
MRRILVTGAGTWVGGRIVQRLERRPDVLVFPVDEVPPQAQFRSDFFRSGLDRLRFADYLLEVRPETVVHLQTVDRVTEQGRGRTGEDAVIGAQALFGAIGRCEETRHVIAKSDVAVYGTSSRNPSVFAEDDPPQSRSGRYQRYLLEMEDFLEETAADHSHIDYTVLRFASIFGSRVGNPLSRLLLSPVVPTVLGFDPRLQFIHEEDAVRAIEYAIDHPVPGSFNVAAPGQLYLSRVLRLGLRLGQPLPNRAFDAAIRGLSRLDLVIPPHLVALWKHGLVVDTTAMDQVLGFRPALTCRQAVLAAYERVPPGSLPPDYASVA